jgi:hypothetical protein
LSLTTQILTINPEFSSGWIARRRILLKGHLEAL